MGDAAVGNVQGGGWLFSAGTASITADTPIAATTRSRCAPYGQQAGPDPARLSIEVPNQPVRIIDVTAVGSPATYEWTVALPAGHALVTVGFVNDFYDAATMADCNLWIDGVTVEGPLDGPVIGGGRRGRVLTCAALDDRACQTQILTGFAARAWRRPPLPAEITALLGLVDVARAEGDDAEAMRLALQQILVSPHFLFRIEVDPDPAVADRPPADRLGAGVAAVVLPVVVDARRGAVRGGGRRHAARAGRADAQVRRMLADPKAVALTDNFAGQWLFIRAVGDQDPDYALYPEYDQALEDAMRAETRRYFQEFLQGGAPMDQFLTADFTFVNDRLAAHYGLPPVRLRRARAGVHGRHPAPRLS